MYFISFTKISMYIFRIYCFWKDKNGPKKGKFANCARPSRFSPIKSVNLQTLSKYHPKIVRRKRKGQETRLIAYVSYANHQESGGHFDTNFCMVGEDGNNDALNKVSKKLQ